MKFFRWHFINDIDKMIYERAEVKILKKQNKILEEKCWEQYKELDILKKENLWLKNHQKIEIVNLERGIRNE